MSANYIILLLSGISGYLLSLTGIPIGWMIGSLITGGILSNWKPSWLNNEKNSIAIPKYWIFIGQWLLGVELGKKINSGVFQNVTENWIVVVVVLLISILFSLLSGVMLWRFSKTDMLTSLIGTAPGGISYLPIFAEEIGANIATVSIIQIVRVLLVISTLPLLIHYWSVTNQVAVIQDQTLTPSLGIKGVVWTGILVIAAAGGSIIAKSLKFPTPWLLGSMIVVAIFQTIDGRGAVWWPHGLLILSQLLIGVSIGSRINKQLFNGLKRTLLVGSLGSIGLIIVMVLCATIVSKLTNISWITAILAFSPGGIAEMAVTAVILDADSTFVVAVQILRITIVIMFLPLLFQLIERRISRRKGTP